MLQATVRDISKQKEAEAALRAAKEAAGESIPPDKRRGVFWNRHLDRQHRTPTEPRGRGQFPLRMVRAASSAVRIPVLMTRVERRTRILKGDMSF